MKNVSTPDRQTSFARLSAAILSAVIGISLLASCGSTPTSALPMSVAPVPSVTLTDRELAAAVLDVDAKSGKRRSALSMIEDQTIVAEIVAAIYDESWALRKAALAKLRDPDVLEALAAGRFGGSENARIAAINRLEEPTRLGRLFHSLVDVNARLSASVLVNISDIDLLTRLAEKHSTEHGKQQARSRIEELILEQRIAAVERMSDEALLLQIAYSDDDPGIRSAAIEQIQDLTTLGKVHWNCSH